MEVMKTVLSIPIFTKTKYSLIFVLEKLTSMRRYNFFLLNQNCMCIFLRNASW